MRFAIGFTEIKQSIPAQYVTVYNNFESMFDTVPCKGQNLVWNCVLSDCSSDDYLKYCQPRKIAIAPYTSSNTEAVTAAQSFITWAEATYPASANQSAFLYFSSEDAIEDYVKSSGYSIDSSIPIVSSAVIFTSGYPAWEYIIRLNRTVVVQRTDDDVPSTASSTTDIDISVQSNKDNPQNYAYPYSFLFGTTGIYGLQNAVNSYVATFTCRLSSTCSNSESVHVKNVGFAFFPNPSTRTNQFWSNLGAIFALLMIIAILYPLANVISSLVREKESKLREGMMMMALRGDALTISWFIHFIALFLPLAILLTIAGSLIFVHSSGIYVFFYFFVFFLSAISYCFFVSTLFNKSRTAAIIGVIFFFGGYFIYVGMANSNPTRSAILAASLHPAAAFTYGTL